MIDRSPWCFRRGTCLAWIAFALLIESKVLSVVAIVDIYVAPTDSFTDVVNSNLTGASADDYVVHLSAGLYTGCGPATIDLSPGSAYSVTVIGAGEEKTTIDCAGVVLLEPVFTCMIGCTAQLQNVTFARVNMTTESQDNVGALVNVLFGSSMTLQTVTVASCWSVTHGGQLNEDLSSVSSILRVSGIGSALYILQSSFFNNTSPIGIISTLNSGHVSVTRSYFESNVGGGGLSTAGLGGVFSFASGAVGEVTQSYFLSNSANNYGGVAYLTASSLVTFADVAIQDSAAQFGGVVYARSSSVTFINVVAQYSACQQFGGVVLSDNGDVFFENVAIQDSTAYFSGGVALCERCRLDFFNVTTERTKSEMTGGGVVYASGDVLFINVVVQDSSAADGGVVCSDLAIVTFVNVTTHLSSARDGGGVVYSSEGMVTFVNVATENSNAGTYGGGVVLSVGGLVDFENVTTRNSHSVVNGGVVSSTDGDVHFVNVVLTGSIANSEGGVIYSFCGTVSFVDVTTEESSSGAGGVVYSSESDVYFLNVATQGSVANDGGVVHSQMSDVNFVNVATQGSVANKEGGVVYSSDGQVFLVNVTTQDSSAEGEGGGNGGGGVVASYRGDVSFVDVLTHDSSAIYGGVVFSEYGNLNFVNVTSRDSTAPNGGVLYLNRVDVTVVNVDCRDESAKTSGRFLFHVWSGQFVARDLFVSSMAVGAFFAQRAETPLPSSTLLLDSCRLSCSGCESIVDLQELSELVANETFIFVEHGVGIFAVGASVQLSHCSLEVGQAGMAAYITDLSSSTVTASYVAVFAEGVGLSFSESAGSLVNCSLSVFEHGMGLSLSTSTGILISTFVTVSDSGLATLSLFSTLSATHSIVDASGSGLALASISGAGTLAHSQVVCSSNAGIVSVSTAWSVESSVIVGRLPLSFTGPALVTASFLGVTAIDAPALSCRATTHLAASITCGGSGSITSPLGTCSNGSVALGSHQPNCHDACLNASFCVPDNSLGSDGSSGGSDTSDGSGAWFDSFGCPRCGGPCWLGTDDCNASLAYCYDSEGGGFMCKCRTGYSGDGVQCEDIDECLEPDACANPLSECLNSPGSFTCPCGPGSLSVGGVCQDVNECQGGSHDCHPTTTCVNTQGSFACACPEGTFGNGTVPCTTCPALSATQGQGALTLTDCLCPANFYLSTATCEACPTKSSSPTGSLDASDCFCEPFYYRGLGVSPESPCEPCPAGSFASNGHQCLLCSSGSFSTSANVSVCTNCPSGSNTNHQQGAVTCTCFPNYNSSGSGDHLVCIQSCPPGWQTAGAFCQVCGAGAYSQDVNSPRCKQCPPGSSTTSSTATSFSECECLPGRIQSSTNSGGPLACLLNCSAGTSYVSGLDQCVPCESGSYWSLNDTTGIGSCILCPFHSYTVGSGATSISACLCDDGFAYDQRRGWCAVQCGPGFALQAASCELCGPGTYAAQANSLSCTACPANSLSGAGATSQLNCSCVPGFYFESIRRECPPCPTGAFCGGGLLPPVAEAGYYEGEGAVFAECSPAHACVGGNECAEGYEGVLCSACSVGYFRINGHCRRCGPGPKVALAVFVVCLLLFSFLLLVCTSRQTGTSYFAVLSIVLPCLQALSLFGEIPLSWPPYLAQLFMVTGVASFDLELLGAQCFAVATASSGAEDGGTNDGDPVGIFVRRWAVSMAVPLMCAGGLALASLVVFLLDRLHISSSLVEERRDSASSAAASYARHLASVTLRAYGIALNILYFPLCAQVLSAYDCVDNGLGQRVLFSEPSVHCSSHQQHTAGRATGTTYSSLRGMAIFFTVVYVAGIPSILIAALLYLRKRLEDDVAFYRAVGGLATSYRGSMYAFEGVLLVRKLMLAVALSAFFGAPRLRLAGYLAIVLCSAGSSRATQPYSRAFHNLVELAALGGLAAILSVGVMMGSVEESPLSTSVAVVLFVLVLSYLSFLFGLWLWDIKREMHEGRALFGHFTATEGLTGRPGPECSESLDPKILRFDKVSDGRGGRIFGSTSKNGGGGHGVPPSDLESIRPLEAASESGGAFGGGTRGGRAGQEVLPLDLESIRRLGTSSSEDGTSASEAGGGGDTRSLARAPPTDLESLGRLGGGEGSRSGGQSGRSDTRSMAGAPPSDLKSTQFGRETSSGGGGDGVRVRVGHSSRDNVALPSDLQTAVGLT